MRDDLVFENLSYQKSNNIIQNFSFCLKFIKYIELHILVYDFSSTKNRFIRTET